MDRTRGRLAHAESSPAKLSLIRVSEPEERVVARRHMIASCRHSAILICLDGNHIQIAVYSHLLARVSCKESRSWTHEKSVADIECLHRPTMSLLHQT